ncbi:MAG: hypothetical protein Q8O56_12885 [Solirubrobacteraceae bacterium]|nr:hypothetical protein [Solirubrobacteraceae bacterium]
MIADEAVELAARAGLRLDPWQADLLRQSLDRREDGRWSHFEVAAIVPRQNGKGTLLEARALAGLYLDPDCRLIVHSAHEFATSLEAFRRLLDLIEAVPELAEQVESVKWSHGQEGVTLHDCSRIVFKTRTKSGGRGLSADLLILDEAMILSEAALGALLPTLSARPNAQVIYTGSAVDQNVHEHGVVLARVRERGQAHDASLAFVEFAADAELHELLSDVERMADPELWRQANPALDVRISRGFVERERLALAPRTFAVERLGVGDWPLTAPEVTSLLPPGLRAAMLDPGSQPVGRLTLAFDVAPNRGRASIAVHGRRGDGLRHVEIVDARDGTGWVVERVAQLVKDHDIGAVRADAIGPAASLFAALASRAVVVVPISAREYASACGEFFDAATQHRLRHPGSPELDAAMAGAATRSLGDAWAWARKASSVDITPLVACTLAAYGSDTPPPDFQFAFG